MAEIATIQSKQPAETKPLSVDFSDALGEGEVIDTATVTAYEWDDRDQVSEEFDLEVDYVGADEIEVTLRAAGAVLGSSQIPLGSRLTRVTVQADNEDAWVVVSDMVSPGSVGWGTDTVTFKVANGTAGHTYKITVFVVTDGGHEFEQDILMTVEEL